MTAEEFLEQAKGYYGEYRAGAYPYILGYLRRYSERQLEELWKQTLLEYSGQYRYPPDIAILESAAQSLDKEALGMPGLWLPKNDTKALPEPPSETERAEELGLLADWRKDHE